ncbi:MAG: response regulator transcription factor [Anaerolineales bacterium]|nr:response regulator transcription factor [Anaerolineales bacterium]
MKRQRIIIVDDHEVVRLGLRALLERHPDFEVIGEASTADEAVIKTLDRRPDVVVMDIRMPGGTGIDACEQIVKEAPECKVIVLTSYAEDEMLFNAIRAGAAGYVLKQIGGAELVRAIETVGRGESLLDPALTSRVFAEVRRAAVAAEAAAFSELTPQELNVLSGIASGKTNREIAEVLHLSPGTVRNYVSNILSKLDVANRAEAAAYAVENRLSAFIEKGVSY